MDNLKGKTVSLAHGAGGKQTSELIDQVFKAHFANPEQQEKNDSLPPGFGRNSVHDTRDFPARRNASKPIR